MKKKTLPKSSSSLTNVIKTKFTMGKIFIIRSTYTNPPIITGLILSKEAPPKAPGQDIIGELSSIGEDCYASILHHFSYKALPGWKEWFDDPAGEIPGFFKRLDWKTLLPHVSYKPLNQVPPPLIPWARAISLVPLYPCPNIERVICDSGFLDIKALEIWINKECPDRLPLIKTLAEDYKGTLGSQESELVRLGNEGSPSSFFKAFCTTPLSEKQRGVILDLLGNDLGDIVKALGINRIMELGYSLHDIREEYDKATFDYPSLTKRVYQEFHVGDVISKENIKKKLKAVYQEFNIPGPSSSKEIDKYFKTEPYQGPEIHGRFLGERLYPGEDDQGETPILQALISLFRPSDKMPCKEAKERLGRIYEEFQYCKIPVSSDLEQWFHVKPILLDRGGKKIRGVQIIKPKYPGYPESLTEVLKEPVRKAFTGKFRLTTMEALSILSGIFKEFNYYREPRIVDLGCWLDYDHCTVRNRSGIKLKRWRIQ